MPAAPYGHRKPPIGQDGMPMSMYISKSELAKLDELREHFGLKRNAMLRRLIIDAYDREIAKG